MAREDSATGVLLFVSGAVVGAALGVLFAPKSGQETREQIGEWLKERREKGSELLSKIKEVVPEKKEAIAAAARAAKGAYQEASHKHNHADKEGVRA